MKNLKKKTLRGIIWTFIDRAGSQFIGFIITLVMARILEPGEFGLVAMASVVIAITRVFIDSGMRDSLIQKQDCTSVDYSTVFYFNMGVSLLLFLIIWITAPLISGFFHQAELVSIIRLMGLVPCIAAFSLVQTAIIHKQMQFGVLAKVRLPAFIVSGVVGLSMAYYGFGVWSLVAQAILEVLLFNIFLWIKVDWKPAWLFDREIFRFHWQHGSRLLVSGVLNSLYKNIFSLIIGKFFSPVQLGYYSRADSFRVILQTNTVFMVQTVSYPVLASMQDDNALLKRTYRKIQQATMFVLLPLVAILLVGAEPIIQVLLTPKWLPAAPILQVLALALVFSPFNSINLNILKAKRRTDLYLRTDLINKLLLVIVLVFAVNLGFEYVIFTNLIMAVFMLFINNYYSNKLLGYSVKEQVIDMWPLLVSFIGSVGGTYYLMQVLSGDLLWLNIIVMVLSIVVSYLLLIYLLNKDFIIDVKNTLLTFNKS